jgi:tetratricopeptide (TPR) repeat protein
MQAIADGERAIGTALDPATLGLVGDAYAAMGDTSKAGQYYHTMEVAVLHQPGPFHRSWSLFLLDHDRDVPGVLAKVREEIQTRRDIYGYDLLAWALHQSGRDREAQHAMTYALALGTRDAMLFFHAGMIERALGEDKAAAGHLRTALEINPYWDPFQPEQARSVLDSLRR